MILDCDLSQIEWRVAAYLSQDPTMLEEIRAGVDQHAATCTASDMMNLPLTKDNRQDAKTFNFRAIYCDPKSAPYAYYMDPSMPSFAMKKWEKVVGGFFEKYSGLAAWHQQIIREVQKTGQLTGPTGRIWKFEKKMVRGYLDYKVTEIRNYPVQGTSGDIIKLATVIANKRRKKAGLNKSKLLINVHDSIVWDSPEDEYQKLARIIVDVFEEIPQLTKKFFGFEINVPITGEAEAGLSWGTTERIL